MVIALLIAASLNQNCILAQGSAAERAVGAVQEEVTLHAREANFDDTVTKVMSACLFNLEEKKSFAYYCDILFDLAKKHKDIVKKRLVQTRSKNTVEDFLKTLERIRGSNSAFEIGIALIKYMDALPIELQTKLKNAGIPALKEQLTLRLAVKN